MKIELEIPDHLTLRTLYIRCPHASQFRNDETQLQYEVYISDPRGFFKSRLARNADPQKAVDEAVAYLEQYEAERPKAAPSLDLDLDFI